MPRAGDERVSDADLIAWVRQLLDQLFPQPVAAPAPTDTAS